MKSWSLTFPALLLLIAWGNSLRADAAGDASPVYFLTDVVPELTKLGCNSGGCHGKATGQNGFKLSLLGFEPEGDYDAFVDEARGRRIQPGSPRQSLMLLKATAAVPHGGGKRIDTHSDAYRTLLRWIENGAAPPSPRDPVLQRIAVAPEQRTFDAASREQQLQVTAYYSDGKSRDVSRQAVYFSNEADVADVNDTGLITVKNKSGLFAVMARYSDQIGAFYGTVPVAHRSASVDANLAAWENEHAGSFVDRLLAAQWRRLGIEPSPDASDDEFLRRASLDICGAVPTPDEVRAYEAHTRSDKRARLIDRLLERPEYASYFALKWADILRNRGQGFFTTMQRPGTARFAGWIRDCIAANMPYDRFVAELLTASGSQEKNPPTLWYRTVRNTQDYVESVAQAFLGVRIQCAQCHHHPSERWSQDDYYGLAAVFARVGRKGGYIDVEVPTSETIFTDDDGEVVHPRTGRVMKPRPLGGPDFPLSRYDDPRRSLARWMTAPDNPYFARTMANRLWSHFFGRGLIHPIDDARSTNPPSNPELLDALARDFVAHDFDVKHLIRTLCSSAAYGLSSIPNESNQGDAQSFARHYPKRLSAEVLLDALSQVLEAPTKFPNVKGDFPAGTRATDLPDEAVPSRFLDAFGRPARTSACECERVDAPALGQTLELVSSNEVQTKLTAEGGYVEKIAKNGQAHADNIREIFVRVFARPPRPEEQAAAVRFVESQDDCVRAYRSLLWALLATNEFLFNH
jgi:hypothetical protein